MKKYFLSFIPVARAQNIVPAPTNVITSPTDIAKLFCGALAWMFWGLIVLGIAMALIGGYTYATAAGDPEKVGKATKTLLYAVIAIAVGIAAQGVPYLISSFFGSSAKFGSVC